MKAFKDLKAPYAGEARVIRTYLDTGHILAGGIGREQGRYHYWVGLWSAARGGSPDRLYEGHTYFPATLSFSPDRAFVASADILGEYPRLGGPDGPGPVPLQRRGTPGLQGRLRHLGAEPGVRHEELRRRSLHVQPVRRAG